MEDQETSGILASTSSALSTSDQLQSTIDLLDTCPATSSSSFTTPSQSPKVKKYLSASHRTLHTGSLNNLNYKGNFRRNASFLEDGARQVVPPTEWGFPRPKKGQTLADFLMSGEFNDCLSPLDRENAHFYIAEAVIQAIEQFKCNRRKKSRQDVASSSDDDDEEQEYKDIVSRRLAKRCRARRQDASVIACKKRSGLSETVTSEYATSLSAPSSDKEDGNESDFSIGSTEEDAPLSAAEDIALCLLRNFKQKRLPKACDLIWMISEDRVPQSLLPLPDSWPVSPDDACSTRIRGNTEWAPPRRQIIFTLFREGSKSKMLIAQKHRCAGCGMLVQNGSTLRFCNYHGKLFCQICHRNNKSVIPARILHRWDFSLYYVSTFALELLDSLYSDPLYNVYTLNKKLLQKSKTLAAVNELRIRLNKASVYISNCRNANKQRLLGRLLPHLYQEVEVYSLQDFIMTKNGELAQLIQETYKKCVGHVLNCQLCQGNGYLCEGCRSPEVIFPFDAGKVFQCPNCNACFHAKCINKGLQCTKCVRVRERRIKTTPVCEAEEAVEAIPIAEECTDDTEIEVAELV